MCAHLAISSSGGLFQTAAMESGYCAAASLDAATAQGDSFVEALGCTHAHDPITCIRSKDTSAILHALPTSFLTGGGATWGPVIDGVTLLKDPMRTLVSGNFLQVPLLLGTNTDEMSYFVYPTYTSPLSADNYTAIVTQTLNGDETAAQQYLELFPAVSGDNRPVLVQFLTDWKFRCPSRYIAQVWDAYSLSAFLYRFNHVPSCSLYPASWGVYHTAEIPFVFDHPYPSSCTFTSAEQQLAVYVGAYWKSMATRGSPSFVGSVSAWPSFHYVHQQNIVLDLHISIENYFNPDSCDLWRQVCGCCVMLCVYRSLMFRSTDYLMLSAHGSCGNIW